MGRMGKAYKAKLRALLERAGTRRLEQGLEWLADRADRLSATQSLSPTEALRRVSEELASKLPRRRKLSDAPQRFFCDAGLGGLARWLRAAGYEAFWQPDIEDDALLVQAQRTATTILTTDSLMMERRLLRDHLIAALWLPPTITAPEQLALVLREFELSIGQPRCMSCGGELQIAAKEALRERIPPRTYRWLHEYFLCRRCGKLFWHGTHWARIQETLRKSAAV